MTSNDRAKGANSTRTPVRIALIEAPRWELIERRRVRIWHPMWQRWQTLRRWTGPILEALEAGQDWDALLDTAHRVPISKRPQRIESRLRMFLFNLYRLGYVTIDRPPFQADGQGRWTQVKELGRGGVAVADLVKDRDTGHLAACKRAWDFLQSYEITEAAIRREAQVLDALDHPGIVRALDHYEVDGHMHLVRDFVDGTEMTADVAGAARDDGSFARVAGGVTDILAHIHERGYLLLDLRPANWYIRHEDGRAMIIDVGQLRRHNDGQVTLDRRVGSQGFMSPEMHRDQIATVRSDLYGLGRLLLFLRTGQLPGPGIGRDQVRERLGADPFAPLLAALVAEDPEDRPPSARAVHQSLTSPPPQ